MHGKKYFAHETSCIDNPVNIGAETKIWHFCHVCAGAQIGSGCSLGQNTYVSGKAIIGNNVKIQNNVSIYDSVVLEDYVFCGPSMVFTNVINPRSQYPKHGNYCKTLIQEGASIGANATIVCGITVGRHAFIGAGSVVTKSVPANAIVYGTPARIQGWMCECGQKLRFTNQQSHCDTCQRQYKQISKESIELI